LFRQGRAALDAEDLYAAAHLLGEALATWRGPAGAGCEVFGWLCRQLYDISALPASAAEGRLVALLMLDRPPQLVMEARALIAAEPRQEPWWACLIAGPRDGGEPGAAQAAHDQALQAFADQYGILPDRVRRLLCLPLMPPQRRGSGTTTTADRWHGPSGEPGRQQ
jgi:DNA-binding SARP family transcriptional activator